MKKLLVSLLIVFAVAAFSPVSSASAADKYPSKPITWILPFAAGNTTDISARIVAEYIQSKHNITVLVTPKPGGSGVPATMEVKRAKADGYTFGYTSANVLTVLPQFKDTGFTYKDFKYVAQVNVSPMVWAVRSDSGITDIADLMKKSEEKGKYNLASPGAFTAQRFYHDNIMQRYPKSDLPYVPYNGGAEVMSALIGKHVAVAFFPLMTVKSYLTTGEVKLLATSSGKRLTDYPDVPTFTDLYGEGFIYDAVYGLIAPGKTPDDRVKRIQDLVKEALNDPGVREKFAKVSMTCDYLPGTDWKKVVEYYQNVFSVPISKAKNLK
ncbi:tripartite tricarboxylate transporter substrate binding protein [Desulfovibrio sp. OttesenSCG-928-O18]|nr:tripartite tricarboxylate transporter substrate binding protein [Desulfovibrio sp. OttesenSCG-928-O18]